MELYKGLRFYMFGNKTNSFKVISFNDTDMFIYSELLRENCPQAYKISQFNEMIENEEIQIF